MASQCFALLVIYIFLSKCLGHTEFIYTAKDEVRLVCDTNKWQIDTEFNNIMDVSCRVECVHGETLNLTNIQKSCTNKDSDEVGEKCSLIATSGFYRCVTALDSGFLYPFKPSPNTVTSYIVANPNEEITTESEERSSVELNEGEDVLLNCSFTFTGNYDNQPFVVYWIKTIEKNSTCVYSYDLDNSGVTYNTYCNIQEELLYRLSNQTEGKTTHNIRIRNATESDTGRYLCALQLDTYKKWKIINNITVSMQKDKGSAKRFDLILIYASISILLALAVVVFIWKMNKTSRRSQATELERNQNGGNTEETADMECSPYAIGTGEEEIKFGSNQDALKQMGQEVSPELYSVVKMNDLYEPSA